MQLRGISLAQTNNPEDKRWEYKYYKLLAVVWAL